MNLLIVDDDLIILEAMKNFLEKEGFEALTTADADEGIEILKKEDSEIDLVITDIMMPYKSGIELLTEIKEIDIEIPIIIVSALDRREVLEVAFNLGAEDFVKKPVNMDELIIRVNKALMKITQNNT